MRAAAGGIAVLVAGCGGAGSAGESDPASAVPADAVAYVEVVVRPEGSQRDDALDAAGKVLLTDDPSGEIQARLDELFGGDLSFERDVGPWLGERAGLWLRPTAERHDFGVLLLSATDTEAARSSLERNGERSVERSHRGSDYLLDDEGLASGVVGDFVAIGPEAAYRRTVDAFEGESLASADEYADAVGELDDERLAHLWADTPALLRLARENDPSARRSLDQLSAVVPFDELPPLVASFAADGSRLAVESRLRSGERLPFRSLLAGGSTPLLQELPGDSWAAMGSAQFGEAVRTTVDDIAGPLGGLVVRREVQSRTGLDLDRDLLDWIGDVAFFVRGTTPRTLDGGLVIQPTDEDRAADAFGRIVGAIQLAGKGRPDPIDVAGADQAFALSVSGSPRPIVLARGSGLVVATLGKPAAEAALGSGDRLGDSDVYEQAQELAGMEPGFLLSMPALVEMIGTTHRDPDFERARPYLEAFTVIAGGMTADDNVATGRLAAGLK